MNYAFFKANGLCEKQKFYSLEQVGDCLLPNVNVFTFVEEKRWEVDKNGEQELDKGKSFV